jgi:predicted nucleic acid-binding protein
VILVADSSALIALSVCNALQFLDVLFKEIKVPKAVFDEVTVEGEKESIELSKYLKDKIESVSMEDYVITDFSIGEGDLEAMALYKKLGADKLLVDDKRARKLAQLNGMNIIGSLGILLIAKEKKLIEKIKPYVEIIKGSDIYISEELIDSVLELAGER